MPAPAITPERPLPTIWRLPDERWERIEPILARRYPPATGRLSAEGYDHRPRSQRAGGVGEEPFLPRAHRAISNLKAWMHGTHRGVGDPHLQVYLEEYVFRHNRRRSPMASFQTLLGLGALHEPTTYDQITRRAA